MRSYLARDDFQRAVLSLKDTAGVCHASLKGRGRRDVALGHHRQQYMALAAGQESSGRETQSAENGPTNLASALRDLLRDEDFGKIQCTHRQVLCRPPAHHVSLSQTPAAAQKQAPVKTGSSPVTVAQKATQPHQR